MKVRSVSPAVDALVLFEDHWFSHRLAQFSSSVTLIGTAAFLIAMGGVGVFFIEALRCFKQELNLDSFERKDDPPTFGTIENA